MASVTSADACTAVVVSFTYIDVDEYVEDMVGELLIAGGWYESAELPGLEAPGACLIGTSLPNANLYYANLEGADLYYASLSGANLEGAYLGGANLEGALPL